MKKSRSSHTLLLGLAFTVAAASLPQNAFASRNVGDRKPSDIWSDSTSHQTKFSPETEEEKKRFADGLVLNWAIQRVESLVNAENWAELARRARTDRSPVFAAAFAHVVFKRPTYGHLYQLQVEATRHGSPGLIKAIAAIVSESSWVYSGGYQKRFDGTTYITERKPLEHGHLALIENIVQRFPKSASFEVQRLLFNHNFAHAIPESLMLQFFARASREFLTSGKAKDYFSRLSGISGISPEKIQLILVAMKNGAKIYEAGATPPERLKYLETLLLNPSAGGSCKSLFARN